jgi:hypothetical protein
MKHRVDTLGGKPGRRVCAVVLWPVLLCVASTAWADADKVLNHYHERKKDQPDAALLYLSENAAAHGTDVRVWRELVYGLLAQRRHAEALAAAEQAHRLDPSDQQMALQRAYLLDMTGRTRLAAGSFRVLSRSADPTVAHAACQAWQTLHGQPDKVLPRPWFAEVYAAPEQVSRYGMGILPLAVRVGKRLDEATQVEAYGSVRVTTDTRSGETVLGPKIYNDNAAIVALGLRARPVAQWPMQLFAELGVAHDLIDRQRDRTRADLRAGLLYFHAWDSAPRCAGQERALRAVGDVYADAVYHSRYNDAVLFNVRVRPGLRLAESDGAALDAYALLAGGTDTRRSAQNRYGELGTGLAVTVFEPWRLTVRAEWVRVLRHENRTGNHTGRLRLEYAAAF